MKIKRKYVFRFGLVCIIAIIALASVLTFLGADNMLRHATSNSDTIAITAIYNEDSHSLSATQTISYKNRSLDILNLVKFHIYANAYARGAKYPPVSLTDVASAYPDAKKNYGNIEISTASVNGQKVKYSLEGDDKTTLVVPLSQSLKPGEHTEIKLDYVVNLANIKHRLGYTENAVNLSAFYPVPAIYEHNKWETYPYSYNGDPFYNDMFNFDVRLTCNEDFLVASSGSLIRESVHNGNKTVHYKARAIRDFACVLSKQFTQMTAFVGKTAVKYYYIDDSDPSTSLKTACDALSTFSQVFIKYPYAQLSVVQTDFLHGGMEYGELVYISSDVTDRTEYNNVIIHEIAHQWWYGLVGNNQNRTAWIDEGLAEYSTLIFYNERPEYGRKSQDIISGAHVNYATYMRLANTVGAKVDTSMNRELNSFTTQYEYVYMTYVRGMLLFSNLEIFYGRTKINNALRNYARDTQFGHASQHTLIQAFENATNAKLQVYFTTYLSGI